ncbi:MAG: magnesium transporter [Gemmatimonadota bacterium]|nr:magnesium transporter [Gemmatimonadota bacterium]
METDPATLARHLTDLLATGDRAGLVALVEKTPAADVAEAARRLDEDEVIRILHALPEEVSADILVEVPEEAREDILERLTPREIAGVVEEMASDDAADVVSELEDAKADEVVGLLEEEDREEIARLLTYAEDTAGGIMQLEVVSVRRDRTVAWTIEKIRAASDEIEDDLFFVYVTNAQGQLAGRLHLRQLILAKPADLVEQLIDEETHAVPADMDQEEVAQIFKKYDLPSVPVVDRDGTLLGRIMVDDIVDVIHEEAEEDYSRLAGTGEEFHEESVVRKAGLRLPWLLAGLGGGVLSALVLSSFEAKLESVIVLAFFIPVIMAMAGNVAMQSSAVMVRGLAGGEPSSSEAARRLLREAGVAVLTGTVCSVSIFSATWLCWSDFRLGLVVGGSMLVVIFVSTSVGALVPLVLDRLKIDPALATGPFVTTSNDILGILIYLSFASFML